LTGPDVGVTDPGGGAPSRTGAADSARGILALLALGLLLRLIIAYLLPGSGLTFDITAFGYWAQELSEHGLWGFYDRPFFHDYTPGYMYVLWFLGAVAHLLRPLVLGGNEYGLGDLLKLPAILADLGLAWLVWSMAKELGARPRAALLGAALILLNPVTWFDSVAWGQVDSVGTLVLLLALRELWRDRPERSAVLAMTAALIKPQLAIFIPILAVVTIRRALRPEGGYGTDPPPDPDNRTGWELRKRGAVRIFSTALAGLVTAMVISLPFRLSLPGLIRQIGIAAGGYPYLTLNAFNPWALVSRGGAGIAIDGRWICDTTVVPGAGFEIRIGGVLLFTSPASTLSCPDGYSIFGFPAAIVGATLLLLALAVVLIVVAKRPDRTTLLVGLTVLAIAFFVLPTRVHERYLYPAIALATLLATISWRWRIATVVASGALFLNLYAVLTTIYPNNPSIRDWLGIGRSLITSQAIAVMAAAYVAVFLWAFVQLRRGALDRLAAEAGGEPIGVDDESDVPDSSSAAAGSAPEMAMAVAPLTADDGPRGPPLVRRNHLPPPAPAASFPVWEDRSAAGELGPIGWLRSRLADGPIRADRSAALNREGGGRLDRFDLWLLLVLVASLLTVRMWRLAEPYQMHFDEVYHPRTATEFLQDWRYGISHDIYEWTHPHLAKYAMAVGIMAWGEDRVAATSQLRRPVVDAAIEPRHDDGLDPYHAAGDRLWVASGDDVRGYDLETRVQVAFLPVAGAVAVAVDEVGNRVFVGTRSGDIRVVDTQGLDAARRGAGQAAQALSLLEVDGEIERLFVSGDGAALVAVVKGDPAGSADRLITIDPRSTATLGEVSLPGVAQLSDGGPGRIAVADANGLAFLDPATGNVKSSLPLAGAAKGVARTTGLGDDRLYASFQAPDGPRLITVNNANKADVTPTLGSTITLPGAEAGQVLYDKASMMVHVLGGVAPSGDGLGFRGGSEGSPTVYVVEPHGNAVYADAALPFVPAAIVMDDNQRYPSSDRQQLLALSADGAIATVPIGRHAFAWRVPGVIAGVVMAALLYVLTRLLFRRREVAALVGFLSLADGMLFTQSRIGMNDSYVGLGIVAAYTLFAALWLGSGGGRRRWVAFAVGMPVIGLCLGLALASKWVAAYAIAGLVLLVLARSALGRVLLIGGLVLGTTVLGYIGISVAVGQTGGNYLFLAIMVGLTLVAVVANVVHPIAWTWAEQRLAIGAPVAAGGAVALWALTTGRMTDRVAIGPLTLPVLDVALLGFAFGAVVYTAFYFLGRVGFGPMARRFEPDDPASLVDPPAPGARGWLNLGSGFGIPALFSLVCLVGIPLGIYVLSYVPWAMVEGHQLVTGWPAGHGGQTLVQLTGDMYRYHNNLTTPHPASSPWWAWPFDFKPVWFYEEGFAGGTSASIYDAGNLVAWWFGIPAMAFLAWQSFARRSPALALVAIAFGWQWLAWARIERAAFQYHYYTALPFLLIGIAYFLAELWHGASRRTWLLARLSAAAAVLAPFGLWLFHRPLCTLVRVTDVNPGSQACPTLIPDLVVSPRVVAIAVVVGVGVVLLLRILLSLTDEPPDEETRKARMRDQFLAAVITAVGVTIAFLAATTLLADRAAVHLTSIPVEPIALVVTIAVLPIAALVATARDARRFVAGAVAAIGFWFVFWYPNFAALPLPANIHNAYQGLLPTYVYPFQFSVSTVARSAELPPFLAPAPIALLVALILVTIAVGYSAWSWRIVLAERRRERAVRLPEATAGAGGLSG
jgi:Gpi18-like mannosyltransferase